MIRFSCLFLICLIVSCKKGNLKHERIIFNNTSIDTIVVVNPDFDDAIDTIAPGDTALIYSYEVLDTQQEFETCAWGGDTLIIKTLSGINSTRSVKNENYWTFTLEGTTERRQQCLFILTNSDF